MEKKNMGLFLVVMAVVMAVSGVAGQTNPPSCVASLIPCQDSLNATTPSANCCSSLRDAVRTDMPCLCNLFQNRDLFRSFQINMTQALELPRKCNITQGIEACNAPAPSPTAGGRSPPGTPGGGNNSATVGTASVSMLVGLLLLWASLHA